MCWTWSRESCAGVRKPAQRMHEWREARAVARLKLRAGQKIVNACLELKILNYGRAYRSASGNRAPFRLVIEVGREVALNPKTLTEVPDDRSLKPQFGVIGCCHIVIRSKVDTGTVS